MKKKVTLILVGAFLAIVILPVLVAQLTLPESVTRTPIELDSLVYEEVSYENTSQDINLAGMLFLPDGEGPFPAVVMITGSGTFTRDNSWYLNYAQHLQARGIAVLLPDKRGTESSDGDWQTASLEDLASDTLAGVSYLRSEVTELTDSIGVLGISQGGVIAPIAASEGQDMAFAINVVGHAVPMNEQILYEENNNLREMGFLPGISNAISYISTFVNQNIVDRTWWSTVGDFDALDYWDKIDAPILVLYGDEDKNVPSDRSRDRLDDLGKDNIEVVMFEGSDHGLEPPEGVDGEYQREDSLELIGDFILEVAEQR